MPAKTKLPTVFDPYKQNERFASWIEGGGVIDGVAEQDAAIIKVYIEDMRVGINVGGKRGERSAIRLNTIRSRMTMLAKIISQNMGRTLTTITEDELTVMFSKMRSGDIKKRDGTNYKSVVDYVLSYKAFWHWHMKRSRKAGRELRDITCDLDTSQEKPKFHYLTFEQAKLLAGQAKPYYRALIWFLFDSGVRAPTELMNIRVSDLQKLPEGYYQLTVRDETSKTFGRKIKLLLCSDVVEQHIKIAQLSGDDFLFTQSPGKTNEYLGRLGFSIFKIGEPTVKTESWVVRTGDEPIAVERNKTVVRGGITLYDFRHCSACYWVPRYKTESSLKYRFGWKNSDMIHYYTEFLGMKDTIAQEDLIDAEEKAKLDQELERQRQQSAIMADQVASLQDALAEQKREMQEIARVMLEKYHAEILQRQNGSV